MTRRYKITQENTLLFVIYELSLLNNIIKKKLLERANLGHGWAAVSRNRYGVEKTVDTHKILINAIKFKFVFKKYDRQNHV